MDCFRRSRLLRKKKDSWGERKIRRRCPKIYSAGIAGFVSFEPGFTPGGDGGLTSPIHYKREEEPRRTANVATEGTVEEMKRPRGVVE